MQNSASRTRRHTDAPAPRNLTRYATLAVCIVMVALTAVRTRGGTLTVFGPQVLTRTTGAPNVYTFTFTVPNVALAYTLHIDTDGLASAVVTLNGTDVVTPNDFAPKIATIDRSVT